MVLNQLVLNQVGIKSVGIKSVGIKSVGIKSVGIKSPEREDANPPSLQIQCHSESSIRNKPLNPSCIHDRCSTMGTPLINKYNHQEFLTEKPKKKKSPEKNKEAK